MRWSSNIGVIDKQAAGYDGTCTVNENCNSEIHRFFFLKEPIDTPVIGSTILAAMPEQKSVKSLHLHSPNILADLARMCH